MRVLLDTHVVLWSLGSGRRLSPAAREAIEHADDLLVSVISFAEVGIKVSLGKLQVPPDLHEAVVASGARVLPLAPAHGLALADLPHLHKDPFDRLLIAQAQIEGLTLITSDDRVQRYDIETITA